MNMKLVKVVRQKKKDADWKSYKDPVAVLKRDLEVFVKECKNGKKEVDKTLDGGYYFQLKDSDTYFVRALILSKEYFAELREAHELYKGTSNEKVVDELMDKFDEVDQNLKKIVSDLNRTVSGLSAVRPVLNELRKTHF